MKQTIEIDVPDGMKAVWNNNKIEFVNIDKFDSINCHDDLWQQFPFNKKLSTWRYCVNHEDRGKINAFIQLINLRDYIRDGWEPDWNNSSQPKFYICRYIDNEFKVFDSFNTIRRIFIFKSKKDAERFLEKFKYLFEQAGDLL